MPAPLISDKYPTMSSLSCSHDTHKARDYLSFPGVHPCLCAGRAGQTAFPVALLRGLGTAAYAEMAVRGLQHALVALRGLSTVLRLLCHPLPLPARSIRTHPKRLDILRHTAAALEPSGGPQPGRGLSIVCGARRVALRLSDLFFLSLLLALILLSSVLYLAVIVCAHAGASGISQLVDDLSSCE